MSGLPAVWQLASIADIAAVNPSQNADLPSDAPVSFVPMAAVEPESGGIDTSDIRPFGQVKAKGYRSFAEGDVLFAKITPCMENGKVAIARNLRGGLGFGSTEFHVLRTEAGINADYVLHFVLQEQFRRDAARNMKGTAGQLRVPTAYLTEYQIPVPPTAEQERIVAVIEEQFSRLDASVAALARVKRNLKRLRAAVLQRTSPRAQEHWKYVTIGESIRVVDYRGRTPPFSDTGIPHLRSFNVKGGVVNWAGCAYVTPGTYQKYMSRGFPEPGDLLFTTEAPMGEVAFAPEVQFCMAQRMMLLKPNHSVWLPEYLIYHLQSPWFQAMLRLNATGTTVRGISSRNFRPLQLFAPPLDEQGHLVVALQEELAAIDALEQSHVAAEARVRRLRSSILAAAFRGSLVPQDPGDKPASVLLERIAAERASLNGQKPTKTRDRRRTKAPA